jgi:predicted nucleic acid-binding protein
MSDAFVADASVAIAWIHPGQANAETDSMLDSVAAGDVLVVPALWPLEVANAVTILVRRRRLTAVDAHRALSLLGGLPITIDHEAASIAFTTLAELASEYGLTVYDATYIELAKRRRLPLASKDASM